MGAFAGGGGILRQARPDSRREILLVAAFYGRARKATAQFYPAMATHFEGVWPNAPILNEAERTPKSLCRFIRFQHGQPNLCGTSRRGPAFDRHRSEDRSVGKACVGTCISRWERYHKKKN